MRLMPPMLLMTALFLTACAAKESGIRDPIRFREVAERTVIMSVRSTENLIACFRENAILLPTTEFIPGDDVDSTLYRLRPFGFTFEEIMFRPAADGGSTAELLLAPGVNARWRRDLELGRLQPLLNCADSP
ncbi:MAG: hypothetical protein SFV21_06460 [Rhodospirillaceae bacterium]|nr:hypothetical protein [Rhodospirillaceae bacterium]